MGLNLENPKRFLPLLLFIGFVLNLIGLGFWTVTHDTGLTILGTFYMMLAVILWIAVNHRRF